MTSVAHTENNQNTKKKNERFWTTIKEHKWDEIEILYPKVVDELSEGQRDRVVYTFYKNYPIYRSPGVFLITIFYFNSRKILHLLENQFERLLPDTGSNSKVKPLKYIPLLQSISEIVPKQDWTNLIDTFLL